MSDESGWGTRTKADPFTKEDIFREIFIHDSENGDSILSIFVDEAGNQAIRLVGGWTFNNTVTIKFQRSDAIFKYDIGTGGLLDLDRHNMVQLLSILRNETKIAICVNINSDNGNEQWLLFDIPPIDDALVLLGQPANSQ